MTSIESRKAKKLLKIEKTPFFSVILPLGRRKAFVQKSLDSILAQDFEDFEVSSVSDNSHLHGLRQTRFMRDKRVHLVQAKETGLSAARNMGVKASRGRYVVFLDLGDTWEPKYLSTLKKLIEDFPGAGLYGTNYWIEDGKEKRENPLRMPSGWRGRRKDFYSLMYYGHPPFCVSSVALPADLARQNPFPEGILAGEDLLVWFKISLKHEMVYFKKPLSTYGKSADINHQGVYFGPLKHMDWLALGRRLKREGLLSKEAEKFTLWVTLIQVRKMIANGRGEQALEIWARCPKTPFLPYQAYLWCLVFLSPKIWKLFQPGVKIARWILTGRFYSRRIH